MPNSAFPKCRPFNVVLDSPSRRTAIDAKQRQSKVAAYFGRCNYALLYHKAGRRLLRTLSLSLLKKISDQDTEKCIPAHVPSQ